MSVLQLLGLAAAAALVHSVTPDHWMPLALVARAERWSLGRAAQVSQVAALGHVAASLLLGLFLAALSPIGDVALEEERTVGLLLLGTGALLLAWTLDRRRRIHRVPPGASRANSRGRGRRPNFVTQIVLPFGVAASPNLAVLPIVLAAAMRGAVVLTLSLVVFTLVTMLSFLVLTLLGTLGGALLRWTWLEREGELISALLLLVLGLLVLAGL